MLQAETDLLVAVTACSVEESACNTYYCTAIGLEIIESQQSWYLLIFIVNESKKDIADYAGKKKSDGPLCQDTVC